MSSRPRLRLGQPDSLGCGCGPGCGCVVSLTLAALSVVATIVTLHVLTAKEVAA